MILPEYLSLLVAAAESGEIPDRHLLKEIKLLRKVTSTSACRRAMKRMELQVDDLFPWERLVKSQSELLRKFAVSQMGN